MSLSLFSWTHLAAMTAMLLLSMWHDVTMRRIPNQLLLWGGLTALGLSMSSHGIGLGSAIVGGMVGFFGFLVFYLLRMLGAGDVKLAGATGLFIGHPDMLWVNLLIMLAGGVMAIAWALITSQLGTLLRNLQSGLTALWHGRLYGGPTTYTPFPTSRARLPYAVAIFLGTGIHVLHAWPAP